MVGQSRYIQLINQSINQSIITSFVFPYVFSSFWNRVFWSSVWHRFDELLLGFSDVLHWQKGSFWSALSDPYFYLMFYWTLSPQISLKSLLHSWHLWSPSDNNYVPQKISFCIIIIKWQQTHNCLNYIHLVQTDELWLKVNFMALNQLTQKEQLIGWIQVMVIFLISVLRIDFSQFCLHNIELTESFLFFFLSELFELLFLFELLLIELLFSQSGNYLHFLFVVLTLSVGHFRFHSFVFFGLFWN